MTHSTLQQRSGARQPPERPNRWRGWGAFLEYGQGKLRFYHELAAMGDLVRVQFGGFPIYFVNHPEYVQSILQQNHRNWMRSDYDRALLGMLVGRSLLTTDGAYWLGQRRLMQPAFHRQRIAGFGRTMVEAAEQMTARWAPVAARGHSLDLSVEMGRLALQIAGLTLFGAELDDEASEIGRAVTVGNRFLNHRMESFPPLPLWLPTPRHRRFRSALRTLDRVIYEMIRAHRADPAAYDDLLSLLLAARDEESGAGMSDEQLRDECITILIAGHETTANALAWTWYEVAQHPAVERRLHQELDDVLGGRSPTIEDLRALPYTRMVIEEAMRLHPPAWAMSRQSIKADELGGYSIPAGAVAVMIMHTIHRHPAVWTAPERFDPLRFSAERAAERPRYAYFPFGGGPHLCIGNQFALTEAQLVLATVAQRFRLRLVPGYTIEEEALITLRPRYGLRMALYPRV